MSLLIMKYYNVLCKCTLHIYGTCEKIHAFITLPEGCLQKHSSDTADKKRLPVHGVWTTALYPQTVGTPIPIVVFGVTTLHSLRSKILVGKSTVKMVNPKR